MTLPRPVDPAEARVPSRYRVHLLPDAKATERGVVYRRGAQRFLLEWERVERALGAQVGGPGGEPVSVLIDLVTATEGLECVACRLLVAPGPEATLVARAVLLALGPDRCSGPLHHLAEDGATRQRYDDSETFEAAALEALRFG
jgi:hypothetical protein